MLKALGVVVLVLLVLLGALLPLKYLSRTGLPKPGPTGSGDSVSGKTGEGPQ